MKNSILAFDTNIWINLAKSGKSAMLDEIIQSHNDGGLRIIVNDVIKLEWQRNKKTTIKSLTESIKSEYKCAKKIATYIQDQAEKEQYLQILSSYKDETVRIKAAQSVVQKVEDFMNRCEMVTVTDEEKLHIASLAIEKKPPMHNNKNNFNDALIARNFCNYVANVIKNESNAMPMKYDFIYVSENAQDFIDPQTKNIFNTITEGIETFSILNTKELHTALEMRSELIEDFDEWLETALEQHAFLEWEIMRGK